MAGELFTSLSAYIDEPGVRQLIEDWLRRFWDRGTGLGLFGATWRKSSDDDPDYARYAQDVVAWAFDRAGDVRPPLASLAEAQSMLAEVLRTPKHPIILLPAALRFLEQFPTVPHSERIVGALLSDLARARAHFASGKGLAIDQITVDLLEPEAINLRQLAWDALERQADSEGSRRATTGDVEVLIGLLRTNHPGDTDRVRDAVQDFLSSLKSGAFSVLASWIQNPPTRTEALGFVLSGFPWSIPQRRLRALALARRIDAVFDFIESGGCTAWQKSKLGQLLGEGVEEVDLNPSAAWALFNRYGRWPPALAANLWQGVLRASFQGEALWHGIFWEDFQTWQRVNRDPTCTAIAAAAGRPV